MTVSICSGYENDGTGTLEDPLLEFEMHSHGEEKR